MNESRSTTNYWLYFFLSTLGIILMLVFVREYFWMALPFVATFFAKAVRIM